MHLKPLLLPLAMLVIVASCGPDDISPGNSRGVYSRVQWLEEEEKWYGHITYEYHQWHRYSEARTGCISGHVSSTGDERRSATIGISGEEVTYLASMNESYKRVSYRNDCLPPECSETEVTTRNLLGSGTTDVLFGVHVEDGVGSFNVEPQGEIGALITGETEYSNCLGSRTSHIEGSLDLGVIVSGKGNVEPGSKPGTVVFQGERAQNGVFLGAEHPEWTETTKWYLTNNPEELIVEVEVVDYDDWRPEGSLIAEIAGNHIEVKATLRRADGGPPKELAQSFTFELAEVSNIPGVAMNYPPPPSPQNEPDLKFDPGTNPDMTLNAPTYSTAKTPEGERDSASVAVGAYDWGAHGIILVTAQLKSGRRIVGWLKGTTENRIRLPKRGRSSFIADVWKQDEAVESQPDDFDEEGIADLEGHTGDGLTLFEEYRGFIIDGRWVSGAPNKRDFFVYNLIGDEAKPGLGIYANASGLAIHDIRASIETGKDRVINFQSHPDARLHRVDQHLVKMVRLVETEREVPFTRTRTKGPTVPKNVIQVEFPPTYTRQSRTLKLGSGGVLIPTQGKIPDRQFDTAIAHELGHTNNIYHHGDVDLKEVEWQADGADIAEVSPAGTTKPLRLFDDTPAMNEFFIPSAKLPFKVYIAKTGGQHSGNVGCLMRYAFAHATVSVADPKYRLFPSDPETLGQALCTSRTGTNINAPGRIPHPRYGDAAPNRGNCLHQVCVNDFFDNHAPR